MRALAAVVSLLLVSSLAEAQGTPLTPEARSEAISQLRPEYRQWLQNVVGLLTQYELDYFLRLPEDFRRDDFMEAFWKPRDPTPGTSQNELRDRWDGYRRNSQGGLPFNDPRFMLLLFNGSPGGTVLPDGRGVSRCYSRSRELEIWFYAGSQRRARDFIVIFARRAVNGPYEIYRPGQNLRAIQRQGGLPVTDVRQLCADELLRYAASEIVRSGDYDKLLEDVLSPPLPSREWLANLAAATSDLPPGAETFEVNLEVAFPARNQSRTAVQVIVRVARDEAPGQRFDGELFHHFQLVGEVIRDGRRFESFRYRFEGPTPEEAATVPLGFTRYLRPGGADLRILLEDVYGKRFARLVQSIEVPRPEGLPSITTSLAADRPAGPTLRLSTPPGNVHSGKIRFRAQAFGELEKVTFYLDDKPVLSKRRPPFSAELDLGSAPEPHRVRVVGFSGGREVATDQIWLNQGAQRFQVKLIEPRPGGLYPGGLTARVQVDTPDGGPPERLELYLNDEPVTTLREPPFAHSLRLAGAEVAVVRAVAYLADGSTAEDTVLVNASPFMETVEVRLVELPVVVTDAEGRPVTGLAPEQFRVFEDGAPQQIRRFEATSDAPVAAALLIDRSASMEPHLDRVAEAAGAFAAAAARSPEDRAVARSGENRIAVLSFADQVTVDSAFTAGTAQVERALAGLDAGGGTALYDSLAQAFNTFADVSGASALVLFSDGKDESSRLTFEQALESARRASATLYVIGLEEAFPEKEPRRALEELAAETGGRAYFLAGLDELAGVYAAILEELGQRYVLAYEPPDAGDAYRPIRVEVDVEDARVRTRKGYFP